MDSFQKHVDKLTELCSEAKDADISVPPSLLQKSLDLLKDLKEKLTEAQESYKPSVAKKLNEKITKLEHEIIQLRNRNKVNELEKKVQRLEAELKASYSTKNFTIKNGIMEIEKQYRSTIESSHDSRQLWNDIMNLLGDEVRDLPVSYLARQEASIRKNNSVRVQRMETATYVDVAPLAPVSSQPSAEAAVVQQASSEVAQPSSKYVQQTAQSLAEQLRKITEHALPDVPKQPQQDAAAAGKAAAELRAMRSSQGEVVETSTSMAQAREVFKDGVAPALPPLPDLPPAAARRQPSNLPVDARASDKLMDSVNASLGNLRQLFQGGSVPLGPAAAATTKGAKPQLVADVRYFDQQMSALEADVQRLRLLYRGAAPLGPAAAAGASGPQVHGRGLAADASAVDKQVEDALASIAELRTLYGQMSSAPSGGAAAAGGKQAQPTPDASALEQKLEVLHANLDVLRAAFADGGAPPLLPSAYVTAAAARPAATPDELAGLLSKFLAHASASGALPAAGGEAWDAPRLAGELRSWLQGQGAADLPASLQPLAGPDGSSGGRISAAGAAVAAAASLPGLPSVDVGVSASGSGAAAQPESPALGSLDATDVLSAGKAGDVAGGSAMMGMGAVQRGVEVLEQRHTRLLQGSSAGARLMRDVTTLLVAFVDAHNSSVTSLQQQQQQQQRQLSRNTSRNTPSRSRRQSASAVAKADDASGSAGERTPRPDGVDSPLPEAADEEAEAEAAAAAAAADDEPPTPAASDAAAIASSSSGGAGAAAAPGGADSAPEAAGSTSGGDAAPASSDVAGAAVPGSKAPPATAASTPDAPPSTSTPPSTSPASPAAAANGKAADGGATEADLAAPAAAAPTSRPEPLSVESVGTASGGGGGPVGLAAAAAAAVAKVAAVISAASSPRRRSNEALETRDSRDGGSSGAVSASGGEQQEWDDTASVSSTAVIAAELEEARAKVESYEVLVRKLNDQMRKAMEKMDDQGDALAMATGRAQRADELESENSYLTEQLITTKVELATAKGEYMTLLKALRKALNRENDAMQQLEELERVVHLVAPSDGIGGAILQPGSARLTVDADGDYFQRASNPNPNPMAPGGFFRRSGSTTPMRDLASPFDMPHTPTGRHTPSTPGPI